MQALRIRVIYAQWLCQMGLISFCQCLPLLLFMLCWCVEPMLNFFSGLMNLINGLLLYVDVVLSYYVDVLNYDDGSLFYPDDVRHMLEVVLFCLNIAMNDFYLNPRGLASHQPYRIYVLWFVDSSYFDVEPESIDGVQNYYSNIMNGVAAALPCVHATGYFLLLGSGSPQIMNFFYYWSDSCRNALLVRDC
jgi:hypothetical protein